MFNNTFIIYKKNMEFIDWEWYDEIVNEEEQRLADIVIDFEYYNEEDTEYTEYTETEKNLLLLFS